MDWPVWSYKSVNQFWLNLPHQNVKIFSHLQMDIFCYFEFYQCRRNAFRSNPDTKRVKDTLRIPGTARNPLGSVTTLTPPPVQTLFAKDSAEVLLPLRALISSLEPPKRSFSFCMPFKNRFMKIFANLSTILQLLLFHWVEKNFQEGFLFLKFCFFTRFLKAKLFLLQKFVL